jgi:hypothetical protein
MAYAAFVVRLSGFQMNAVFYEFRPSGHGLHFAAPHTMKNYIPHAPLGNVYIFPSSAAIEYVQY